MKSWGNLSGEDIKALFLKIGIHDVFDGLNCQKCKNSWSAAGSTNLTTCAIPSRGSTILRVNDAEYSLKLQKVKPSELSSPETTAWRSSNLQSSCRLLDERNDQVGDVLTDAKQAKLDTRIRWAGLNSWEGVSSVEPPRFTVDGQCC